MHLQCGLVGMDPSSRVSHVEKCFLAFRIFDVPARRSPGVELWLCEKIELSGIRVLLLVVFYCVF